MDERYEGTRRRDGKKKNKEIKGKKKSRVKERNESKRMGNE